MKNKRANEIFFSEQSHESVFTCRSGLKVNAYSNTWKLLANKGKGHEIKIGWVHSNNMPEEDRALILEVYIFYAKNRVASTTETVMYGTKPCIGNGIPTLWDVKAYWSKLKLSQKKCQNQFFSTLKKLGHKRFDEYHQFTSNHLSKENKNNLDLEKGAMSDIEFDSLAQIANANVFNFDWSKKRSLAFYQSQHFSRLRNAISSKLLLSIVRRPIQIAILKWSDAIPAGYSFNDDNIKHENEIGTVGSKIIQLRVFKAKEKKVGQNIRDLPERHPLHLHEKLSKELMLYKKLCLHGIRMLIESCNLKIDDHSLVQLMNNMPIFPVIELFNNKFDSIDLIASLFTPNSSIYHVSDNQVTRSINALRPVSDRIDDCKVSSNRIRHTVLTRGAQDGLNTAQLAKITGVTDNAVRHYIDLDYSSRRLIDTNYIGNEFLKKAFNTPISEILDDQEYIYDYQFNPVGGTNNANSCTTCSTKIGKPLGCYGCPNFRPILEADHGAVLRAAEIKREVNKQSLINPLHRRSIEKLDRQISWVKYTMDFCNETLLKQSAIDAQ